MPVGRVQKNLHSADSLKIVSKVWKLHNKTPPDGRAALRPSRPDRLSGTFGRRIRRRWCRLTGQTDSIRIICDDRQRRDCVIA